MAVYKVIQDIESEDKLLGPLSLKGLVYAGIVAFCSFINFKLFVSVSLGPAKWLFIFILLFPTILFGVLASPLGREQPTEVWLLSRVRFFLKARTRVWSQTGISTLVTVTAPKKTEKMLVKNLTQTEVKSRLEVLANTLDSRGWAIKHVNVNLNNYNGYLPHQDESDRLISPSSLVSEVPSIEVKAADDILDAASNPTAQNFSNLMVQAESQRKQQLQQALDAARVGDTPRITDIKITTGFGENAKPVSASQKAPSKEVSKVTEKARTAKLELAQSGNDLSIASIAKLANREGASSGEVTIALH